MEYNSPLAPDKETFDALVANGAEVGPDFAPLAPPGTPLTAESLLAGGAVAVERRRLLVDLVDDSQRTQCHDLEN